jgi:hypothetical protein
LPASVTAIDSKTGDDGARVTFRLNGSPTIRSFREEQSLIVDIESIATPRASSAAPSSKAAADKPAAAKIPAARGREERKTANHSSAPASDSSVDVAPAESHLGASQMALLGLTPPEITPPADLAQVKEPEHKAARAESATPAAAARADHQADAPARATPPAKPEAQTKSPPAAARKAEQPRVDPCVERAPRLPFRRTDAGSGIPPRQDAVAGVRHACAHRDDSVGERARHPQCHGQPQ